MNVISKHTCEVFMHTHVSLKGLHTKAQHEKCSIQIYVFHYTGVFVMRDFPTPDRDGNMEKIDWRLFELFVC